MNDKVTLLRTNLAAGGILVVPTAYDALSARVIEETGFEAVHVGGFLGAACLLGMPDLGLLTETEAITRAGNISDTIRLPVIMDIDTGYGNAINVRRTINDCVHRGIAAVHIEDQVFPKRCGQYGQGRMAVISIEEMVGKISAARDAGGKDDLFLIARTDAMGADLGVDEVISRMSAYADAGADAVLPICRSVDDLREICRRWTQVIPLVSAPTRFASISAAELESMGIKIALYTEIAIRSALFAVRAAMKELRDQGTVAAFKDLVLTEYLYEMVRLPAYRELEDKYQAL